MPDSSPDSLLNIAEVVRAACLQAAMQAYEDAGISGLCQEGRWELALAAMRDLDLGHVLEQALGRDALTLEAQPGSGAHPHATPHP